MQLLTFQKNLGPFHLLTKTDKWDYLQCPIIGKKSVLVLTLGKFLTYIFIFKEPTRGLGLSFNLVIIGHRR